MTKKQTIIYLIVLVFFYLLGMFLVMYGSIIVGKGTNLNNPYFIVGLVVWVPTCIMSVVSTLSSNYINEIVEKEEEIKNRHQK